MLKLHLEGAYYTHRANDDGTLDSICPQCYSRIGTSVWEADLERMESAHTCVDRPRFLLLVEDLSRLNSVGPTATKSPLQVIPSRRSA
jgi:hypothetical protein